MGLDPQKEKIEKNSDDFKLNNIKIQSKFFNNLKKIIDDNLNYNNSNFFNKFNVIFILIVICILFIFLYNIKTGDIVLYINNEKVVISFLNNDNINLKSFNVEKDVSIKCVKNCRNLKINNKKIDKEITLKKMDISKKNTINVSYNGKVIRKINTLPDDFPEYKFEGKSNINGDYYITTYSNNVEDNHYILKLNEEGDLLFYKKVLLSFDFNKVITSDNKIRYTYLETTKNQNKDIASILQTRLIVMDENYNVINKIKYSKNQMLENHAYLYFNDDEYIISTYEIKNVKNISESIVDKLPVDVIANKIKYMKNNKVLWEFDTSDYPELYDYSTTQNNFNSDKIGEKDYAHINSMAIDPKDGNLLVSFRNIDSIIKLDIDNGKIIWILGGKGDEFSLDKSQLFYKQHSISFNSSGSLNIFDNGNDVNKTRIIKLKYDNKDIVEYKDYDIEGLSIYMGSVQVLDEDKSIVLICYGGNEETKYAFEEKNLKNNTSIVKFSFKNSQYLYKVNKK